MVKLSRLVRGLEYSRVMPKLIWPATDTRTPVTPCFMYVTRPRITEARLLPEWAWRTNEVSRNDRRVESEGESKCVVGSELEGERDLLDVFGSEQTVSGVEFI